MEIQHHPVPVPVRHSIIILLIKSKFMCLLILMYQMHSWYLDLINDNDVSISSIICYLLVSDAFNIHSFSRRISHQ